MMGIRKAAEREREEISTRSSKVYVRRQEGMATVSLGERNIWDVADMRLLRDVLERLVHVRGCRVVGIDMVGVQSLASGFFGILYDLYRQGVSVRLQSPHPCVREMLWFRAFCEPLADDWWVLVGESQGHVLHQARREWRRNAPAERRTPEEYCVCARLPDDPSGGATNRGSRGGNTNGDRSVERAGSPLPPPAVAPFEALGAHLEFGDDGDVVSVKLSASKITDLQLVCLQCLTRLERVLLDNTRIGDEGLRQIGELTSLKSLDLMGTAITDDGLRHLRSLGSLEELNLSRTEITAGGLVHLRDLPSLRSLSLYDTMIDDEAVAELSRLTGLRQLWLGRTRITEQGLVTLQQALPNCRVV